MVNEVQHNVTIPGAAIVNIPLNAFLNSALIHNTSTQTGGYVRVYLDDGDGYKTLQPGEQMMIYAEDTSTNPMSGKICTKMIRIGGQVTCAVVVDMIYTTKYFPEQGVRGYNHPVED